MATIGDIIRTIKSSGLVVDEYQGKYYIMSAWVTRDGEIKANFIKTLPSKIDEGRIFPLKICIGLTRDEAISNLKTMIDTIIGDDGPEQEADIPF
jgi:hypothetical protein